MRNEYKNSLLHSYCSQNASLSPIKTLIFGNKKYEKLNKKQYTKERREAIPIIITHPLEQLKNNKKIN